MPPFRLRPVALRKVGVAVTELTRAIERDDQEDRGRAWAAVGHAYDALSEVGPVHPGLEHAYEIVRILLGWEEKGPTKWYKAVKQAEFYEYCLGALNEIGKALAALKP